MGKGELIDEVRSALPKVHQYRDLVEGDPDLSLAVVRIEQVEDLLEAIACARAADNGPQKMQAEAKVRSARLLLRGPILAGSLTNDREDVSGS